MLMALNIAWLLTFRNPGSALVGRNFSDMMTTSESKH